MVYKNNFSLESLVKKISKVQYTLNEKIWGGISYEAILFVKACLQPFPFVRLSTKEALYHPWIKGVKLEVKNRDKKDKIRRQTICCVEKVETLEILCKTMEAIL